MSEIKRTVNQVYNHLGYLIRTVVITGFDEAYVYCDLYDGKDIKRATGHKFPHGDEPFEPLTKQEMRLVWTGVEFRRGKEEEPVAESPPAPPSPPAPQEKKAGTVAKRRGPARGTRVLRSKSAKA